MEYLQMDALSSVRNLYVVSADEEMGTSAYHLHHEKIWNEQDARRCR